MTDASHRQLAAAMAEKIDRARELQISTAEIAASMRLLASSVTVEEVAESLSRFIEYGPTTLRLPMSDRIEGDEP